MNKLAAKIDTNQADTLPATMSQIEQAEAQLDMVFSSEYKVYLQSFGVISYESQETFGLGVKDGSYLNIVTALKDFRDIPGFPKALIPLAEIGDGHYYMYDNNRGKVVSIALPDLGIKDINDDLQGFLLDLMFS